MNPCSAKRLAIALLSLCGFTAGQLSAEQISIPIGQQSAAKQVETPRKGMTKTSVEAAFGSPLTRTPARGEPPISSWKYPEFVVYFEHEHVIHSVLIHTPQKPSGEPAR